MRPKPAAHRVHVTIREAVDDRYPVELRRVDELGADVAVRSGTVGRDDVSSLDLDPALLPNATEPEVDKAGLALFDLLDAAGLSAVWAAPQLCPLLFDIRPQELDGLPWELLRAPGGIAPFRDAAVPAIRARLPWRDPAPRAPLPVHVLVIVGDPDDADLAVDAEIDAIHDGLRTAPCCWQVEVLTAPTQQALFECYPEIAPDIVHIIGHGVRTPDGPGVAMRPPGAPGWDLTADFVTGAMLAMPAPPRLVVLNACRTAEEPNRAARLARALTSALLERDTPAVVAMQGDVDSGAAATFSRSLYAALAGGRPLDEAVVAARAAVRFAGRFPARDWALPLAEITAAPAAVLGYAPRIAPAAVLSRHRGFRSVGLVVDRAPQRRILHRRIRPEPETAGDSLLFVTGEPEVGKSSLARACVVAQAVRGDGVVYHSLENGTVCAADFVLGVVDAARRWLGRWATPLCDETAAGVAALFGRPAPGGAAAVPPADLMDLTLYTPARPNVAYAPVDDAYRSLQALLVALARTQPLVLVLDHVGRVDEPAALVRGLIEPAATPGGLPGVQIVVVEGSDRIADLLSDPAGDVAEALGRHIPVPAFGSGEVPALVREFLTRIRPDPVDTAKWAKMRSKMIMWAAEKTEDADVPFTPVSIHTAARYHADLAGIAMDATLGPVCDGTGP